jgi:N-acetylglucosamine-6-phosphate deacetylase
LDNEMQALFAERVFDGREWHDDAAVLIEGDRIVAVTPQAGERAGSHVRRLPRGAFLAAGFIDLQVNGGGGILLNDDPSAEAMRAIARAHRRLGTTALLPTLITDRREKMIQAIDSARAVAGGDGVLGLHLEGPFINPARAGVHSREHIAQAEMSDLALLRRLGDAGRSLVTLAPECAPDEFVPELVHAGIRVAAGHSEASAEIMRRAIEDGLSGVTHLYNAMPPLGGRAPGIVGAAFADRRVIAGLIVDGLHVDSVAVRAAFAAKGADRIALVTDAMPTVGSDMQSFELPGRRIVLRDGRLQTADGTLAGAHLDMVSAVRNTVTLCGIPLEDALCAASSTPARFLGLENERGALIPNARADLVALSADLHLLACWVGGVEVG